MSDNLITPGHPLYAELADAYRGHQLHTFLHGNFEYKSVTRQDDGGPTYAVFIQSTVGLSGHYDSSIHSAGTAIGQQSGEKIRDVKTKRRKRPPAPQQEAKSESDNPENSD